MAQPTELTRELEGLREVTEEEVVRFQEQVEPFYPIAFGPIMGRNAKRMLNRPVGVRYFADILSRKMPKGGIGSNPTPWHQDLHPTDRGGLMTFWFALNEVTPDMGSMR